MVINGGVGCCKRYIQVVNIWLINSTTAFQIQDSLQTNLFNIDTITKNLTIKSKIYIFSTRY
jgi:hypothetical protein